MNHVFISDMGAWNILGHHLGQSKNWTAISLKRLIAGGKADAGHQQQHLLRGEILGSPKTNFVFTHNSIYHMYSYMFDPPDPNLQFTFVKAYLSIVCAVLIKFYRNQFHDVSNPLFFFFYRIKIT